MTDVVQPYSENNTASVFDTVQPIASEQAVSKQIAGCPVDHGAYSQQKTASHPETSTVPLERDGQGVWHVRGFEEARSVLRSTDTRQAGFGADEVAKATITMNVPILYQEGKAHQQQRKQTARYFAPKTVTVEYRQFMETFADQLIAEFKRTGHADLSQLSLKLAVAVASQVVGLTEHRLPGMDRRLNAFFEQPPATAKNSLRGRLNDLHQTITAIAFYFLDVQPAIQTRKRAAREDVISHLIGLNYNDREIVTECVTYAAAGMVTTREFISLSAWHLIENSALRQRYLIAAEAERYAILYEILRLEPVVSHLQRRATADIPLQSQGASVVIQQGDLIDIHLHATNADPGIVGDAPLAICPGRTLHGEHVPEMVMSFGDGHHRCPGAYVAIQETDIFLQRLLALDTLQMKQMPTISWNHVASSYEIRQVMLTLA